MLVLRLQVRRKSIDNDLVTYRKIAVINLVDLYMSAYPTVADYRANKRCGSAICNFDVRVGKIDPISCGRSRNIDAHYLPP